MENDKSEFKIIRSNKNDIFFQDLLHKNTEIENIIFSAAKSNKKSEVKAYFKNIPADEYTLGYKKFCGIKINDFVFFNPSLFDLYPKFIDFIYTEHECVFNEIICESKLFNSYFSNDKSNFTKCKQIINTNIYINLDLSFDVILDTLDKLTQCIYKEKVLKILVVCYIKN